MMRPELHPRLGPNNKPLLAHLTWFTRNLGEITPFVDGEFHFPGVKALAELAMVQACLDDWRTRIGAGYESWDLYAAKWRDFMTAIIEDRAYAEAARKSPPHAYFLLSPYLMLRGSGYRSAYHEHTLRLLEKWGYPRTQEVVPYRLLDRELFFWKAGCRAAEPDWRALYRQTTLAAPGSLAFLDRDGAYSMTHTILYMCDFGARRAPLDRAERDAALRAVEGALLHYWRIGNWDLVGELLASLDCLQSPASLIRECAAAAFRAAATAGAVPADREAAERIHREGAAMSTATCFSLCYHTTLVAILQACIERNRHVES